jgi:hypothetical protein
MKVLQTRIREIKMRFLLACFLSFFSAQMALAHAPSTGPQGGMRVDAGSYHVELVVKGSQVDVYVSDEAYKPVAVTGFGGTAILIVDGQRQKIELQPKTENRLSGIASSALNGSLKGAVQIKPPNGAMVQGVFQ